MRRAGPEWVAPKKTSNGRLSFDIEVVFSLHTTASNPRLGTRLHSAHDVGGLPDRTVARARAWDRRGALRAHRTAPLGGARGRAGGGCDRRGGRLRDRRLARVRGRRDRRSARRRASWRHWSPARSPAAARAAGRRCWWASHRSCSRRSRSSRSSATSRRSRFPRWRPAPAAAGPSATPDCAASRATSAKEADPGRDRRPHAGGLRRRRRDRVGAGAGVPRAAWQLPPRRLDLPLADAGLPLLDRHRRAPRRAPDPAPRLVRTAASGGWSSTAPRSAAIRAAGMRRSIVDTIFNMNEQHLGRDAVTVFEALEEAGLTTAAVNITCYRGRTPHLPVVPGLTRPAYGPKRVLLLQPVRVGRDRRAGRGLRPLERLDRRLRGLRRPLARDARRLRPARLLPAGLRLRLARAWAGRERRRPSRAATPRSAP